MYKKKMLVILDTYMIQSVYSSPERVKAKKSILEVCRLQLFGNLPSVYHKVELYDKKKVRLLQ